MVFCYSTLVEHNVVATLALGNDTVGISNISDNGAVGFLGFGPNGISFANPTNDGRITGITDAVRFVLTEAISSLAGTQGAFGTGISTSLQDTVLSNATLTAPLAQTVYLLYQAFISPVTLVVGSAFQQNATYEIPAYRLVADKPVAHTMTALCALTGVFLIVLSYHHQRRFEVRLAAEPLSLAGVAAILPESRLARTADLLPGDTLEEIDEKLRPFRFRLENGLIQEKKSPVP